MRLNDSAPCLQVKLFVLSIKYFTEVKPFMVQVNEVVAERSWFGEMKMKFGEMKMKSGLCCERAFNVMPWILNYSCENLYKTIL